MSHRSSFAVLRLSRNDEIPSGLCAFNLLCRGHGISLHTSLLTSEIPFRLPFRHPHAQDDDLIIFRSIQMARVSTKMVPVPFVNALDALL